MTKSLSIFLPALAGAALIASGALAQAASTGAMSSDTKSEGSMMASDHMMAAKTTDHMSAGKHMAAHKMAKKAGKAKTDHMSASTMMAPH